MSALYFGTGKLEQYLLDKINTQIESNPSLKVNFLMDYMRGTRIGRDGDSTYNMLKGLKVKHYQRDLRCGFWHNPDTGFVKGKGSNGPLREVFGVHHIKAYVFDSNVVITGANLSEDYFTDRQDRYMVIQDCAPLANYVDDLISVLTDVSFNIDDNGDLKMLPHYEVPYKNSKKFKN
jgi:CDP-diacylglycerol---glycerol-3-phosphate 3-phosphatidyltransferase